MTGDFSTQGKTALSLTRPLWQEGLRQALTMAERDSAVPSAVRRLMAQAFGKMAGCGENGLGREKLSTMRCRCGD